MWWEKVEGETEVWRWESSEGFDEDVRYGFVFGKVGVELVAVDLQNWLVYLSLTQLEGMRKE